MEFERYDVCDSTHANIISAHNQYHFHKSSMKTQRNVKTKYTAVFQIVKLTPNKPNAVWNGGYFPALVQLNIEVENVCLSCCFDDGLIRTVCENVHKQVDAQNRILSNFPHEIEWKLKWIFCTWLWAKSVRKCLLCSIHPQFVKENRQNKRN